jgi:hypothetical protein
MSEPRLIKKYPNRRTRMRSGRVSAVIQISRESTHHAAICWACRLPKKSGEPSQRAPLRATPGPCRVAGGS